MQTMFMMKFVVATQMIPREDQWRQFRNGHPCRNNLRLLFRGQDPVDQAELVQDGMCEPQLAILR